MVSVIRFRSRDLKEVERDLEEAVAQLKKSPAPNARIELLRQLRVLVDEVGCALAEDEE
jgi:hypothetical protein